MKNVIKGTLQVPSFYWWIGVVESRMDGEELGRYKVRIIGYHNADKTLMPTKDLPWAVCIQPTTSAGAYGVGETPGLIEGSSVIGFFADGEDGQQPIILGSFAGISMHPGQAQGLSGSDKDLGFNDPYGRFPQVGEFGMSNAMEPESDLSGLARGSRAEDHEVMLNKRKTRLEFVPRAILQPMISVDDSDEYPYDRTDPTDDEKENGFSPGRLSSYWHEPFPRYGVPKSEVDYTNTDRKSKRSQYPYNHVKETESGHVFEVDDTPENERLHTRHRSGTFEEIQADGTKVTKIVKDKYEIVVGNDKVFIRGDADVTVEGTTRLYVMGDCIQEIEGNQYTTIKGNRVTAIKGNDILEVSGDQNRVIQGSRAGRVGKDDTLNCGRNRTVSVVEDLSTGVSGNSNWSVAKDDMVSVDKDRVIFVKGSISQIGVEGIKEATNQNITSVAVGDITVEAGVDCQINAKTGGLSLLTGDKAKAGEGNITIRADGSGDSKKITIQTEKIVEIKGTDKVDINP